MNWKPSAMLWMKSCCLTVIILLGRRGSPEQIDDRAAKLGIGEIGHAAASGHAAVSLHRGAHCALQSLLQPGYPGVAVADPGRASLSRLVAFEALRLHSFLPGSRGGRRFPADRLHPFAAGLIDHVGDGALDLEIGEVRLAAMRRHPPDARQALC